jgi:2,4-dienoyl-CoA reductase-like NADH-dependent reductase (Old Yellow Enzyme family)
MDLGSPLTLPCGAILPNRLCKAAMTEGLSPDGRPTEGHIQLYRMWAQSTAGLLITGNVQVDRHHLERPGNVVLQNGNAPPDTRAVFEQWADAARSGGGKVWMQLSHAGRQTPALVNPHPYAPSAVPLAIPGRFGSPLQMPESLIKHLVGSFARASAVAQAYGFDGVQVHAAHGYLLSSFLSPRTNLRTDAWGGSLDRRARLLLEIVGAVRAEVGPNFPVSVKLNSADFQQGGFDFEDALTVAGWLADAGVDLLELSGGSYEQASMMGRPPAVSQARASTRAREGYFLDFARAMMQTRSPPLMVTGGFRSAAGMIEALHAGVAMVGLARPLCAEPDGPRRLLEGEISELARWEDRVIPSALVSKAGELTPIFSTAAWYYQQIRRLGRGAPPDPDLDVVHAFLAEREDDAAFVAGTAGLES